MHLTSCIPCRAGWSSLCRQTFGLPCQGARPHCNTLCLLYCHGSKRESPCCCGSANRLCRFASMLVLLRSDQRNTLYSAVCGLEKRLVEQTATSNRARLLAFCKLLAAAVGARRSSWAEPHGTPQAASTRQHDSTAAAVPLQPSSPSVQVPAAAAADAGVTKPCDPPASAAHRCSSSAEGTEPGLVSCAHPEDLAAEAFKAAQHQPQHQDEPPAPQTPQKVAPMRPRSAQPQPATDSRLNPGAPNSERVVCSGDAASSNAQAAAAVQPTVAAAMQTMVGTEHTSAAARHPPIGEAEAVALAASCAQAVSAAERSAAGPLPWPLYFIATRDCFSFELAARTKQVRTLLAQHAPCQQLWSCCNPYVPSAESAWRFLPMYRSLVPAGTSRKRTTFSELAKCPTTTSRCWPASASAAMIPYFGSILSRCGCRRCRPRRT
jgi:hypothetical protein